MQAQPHGIKLYTTIIVIIERLRTEEVGQLTISSGVGSLNLKCVSIAAEYYLILT